MPRLLQARASRSFLKLWVFCHATFSIVTWPTCPARPETQEGQGSEDLSHAN